ncbi:MAG: hypothetical protein JSS02_25820 [Planctomycetes bacterium]|nr:hypothetical protein [Planctomycetota bacterium]
MIKPDDKTPNRQRADRAWKALVGYSEDTWLDGEAFTNLVDFLADSMHWCDATGQDFFLALAQACRHYIHELNDEQHDERRLP